MAPAILPIQIFLNIIPRNSFYKKLNIPHQMFTSRTDRKLHLEIPAGAHLSPQEYIRTFTSLKPLLKQ